MSLKRNLISNLILTSSNILFPLITFPYITRVLSNDNYGRISFIDAFTGYILVFATIGIPFHGVREIAKVKNDPQKYSKVVVELSTIQFILATSLCIAFLTAQRFIPSLHNNLNLIKISCLTIFISTFSIEWFFQGVENFGFITSRSIFTKILSVTSILLLVKHSDDYVTYYLISAVTISVNAIWNCSYFLKRYYTSFTEKLEIWKHIKPLLILFSIGVSVSIYTVLDTIILGFLTKPATVSLYAVPLKLVKMYWTVVSGVGVVMIPRVSSLFADNDLVAIHLLMKKSSSIIFLLTVPFTVFCMIFPREILFIISGNKYLESVGALRLLSVVPLIIGFCNVLGPQYLMPIGKEKKILYATICGLVVSLSLNFMLIPHFGHMGASIACVAAESTVFIYIYFAARKSISLTFDYLLLLQIFLSVVAAIAAGILLKPYFYNLVLLCVSVFSYLLAFIFLQYMVFKNEFIFSLLRFRKKPVAVSN